MVGARQRLARAAEERAAEAQQSQLALVLLRLWCWGWLSPQTMQLIGQQLAIELAIDTYVRYVQSQFLAKRVWWTCIGSCPRRIVCAGKKLK